MESNKSHPPIPLNKSPDLICSLSADHIFLSINFAFQEITQYSNESLSNVPFGSLVHPQERDYVIKQLENLQENEHPTFCTFRLKTLKGDFEWMHFSFFYDENARIIWATGRGEASIRNNLVLARPSSKEQINFDINFPGVISSSHAFEHILDQMAQVASTDVTTMLYGESGTGKGIIANAIHARSKRSKQRMVKIDCATLPRELIESELFGYEKGAFTGAIKLKRGKFEQADGGTIFLDEIGEIPLDLQAKLLRVIQDKEFMRIGGLETIKVDVRIIAATNRDLKEAIQLGSFREDLFYRLHVFPIYLPPLRERILDIPTLIKHFLQHYALKHKQPIVSLAPECIYFLLNYAWPGNVRELKNLMERVIVQQQSQTSKVLDLLDMDTKSPMIDLSESTRLEEMERQHIIKVMLASGWKIEGIRGAAQLLGLPPSTLRGKMKKLNIERPIRE